MVIDSKSNFFLSFYFGGQFKKQNIPVCLDGRAVAIFLLRFKETFRALFLSIFSLIFFIFSLMASQLLIKVEWQPVRLFVYMFLSAFLDLTVHNVQQHSYHFVLTDQWKHCIDLLNSVTIFEQKTKDCARSGSFQHKLQRRCFPNQSPLLAMVTFHHTQTRS